MNRYQLIGGFEDWATAHEYAADLPAEAKAKVVPYSDRHHGHLFAVDVDRTYVGGRL